MNKTFRFSRETRRQLRLAPCLAAAVALTLAGNARGATWSGNTSVNWNAAANWAEGFIPVDIDTLVFGTAGSSGTNLNNDLAAGAVIGGITFNTGASGFTLNGNAISLIGPVTNSSTALQKINLPLDLQTQSIFTTTAGGGDITLGRIVSGFGGITTSGSGVLTLSNTANSYTGETIFGGGIVNVASLSDYGVASSIGARDASMENNSLTGIGLHFKGGTLQYTGSTPQSTNREIRILGGGTAPGVNNTIDASGSTPEATLSFTHTGTNINLFDTSGHRTLTLTGTNTGKNSFSIRLTDQSTTSGLTTLAKAGTGTWYITNSDNTYSGETIIKGGILNVASLSDYGVASSIGARTLAQENTTTTGVGIHFQGGTLQYTGSTPQSTNRNIRLLGSTTGVNNTIDASGSTPEATLSFTKTGVNMNLFDTGGIRTLTLTGTNTGNNSFSIQLINQGSSPTHLTKTGVGTWVLNGPDSNTSTGTTTVSGGTLVLAKTGAIAASGNVSIGDGTGNDILVIGGTGGNQIADTSIVTLTGTGADAGILRLNNNSETIGGLGGSGIVENASGATGTGTLTVNVASGSQTFDGVLRDGSGTGIDGKLAFTKTGTGTLTLSGASTHTGATTISAGTLTVNGSLGAGTVVSVTNATLNGSGTIAGPVSVGNNGILSGTGTISGAVTLATGATLSGTSTLTGGVTAAGGSRISPGGSASIGRLTFSTLKLESGSLLDFELGGTSDMIAVTGAGGLTLNGGAFNLFEAGGTTPLGTNGNYTLLDYTTAYTGSLANLSIANSQVGKFYNIVDDTTNTRITLTVADATVTEWSGSAGNGQWTNTGNWSVGTPNSPGTVAKFGLTPTSPTTITVNGAKTVGGILFDNANAYTVSGSATDVITLNNGVAAASITVNTGSHVLAAPIALATSANATTAVGTTLTISGDISGEKSFIASGSGTTVLSGSNSYTTTLINGGTLRIGDNGTTGTLGSGDVTVAAGGTLVFSRSNDLTVANNIFGAGAQVTKLGAGILTLTGTNTFATAGGSGFNINAGTVKLGSATALVSGVVLGFNGGTLDLNGNSVNPSYLTGTSGTITDNAAGAGTTSFALNQSGTTTYAGSIANGTTRSIAVTKSGSGTITLTGNNTFTGGLTITQGAVIAAGTNGNVPIATNVTLGDGTNSVYLIAGAAGNQFGANTVLTFDNGAKDAKLQLRGSNQTLAGIDSIPNPSFALSIIQNDEATSPGYTSAPGVAMLTLNTTSDHSFAGIIRSQVGGPVNLVKEGPATQEIRNILAAAHTFGTATINAGKLVFNLSPNANNTNTLGTGTSVLVNANGTLGLDGSWNMNRVISGEGTVLKQGTGAVTLSGANTYTGTTIIAGGSLTAATTGGTALPGNVTFGTGEQGGLFLIMGAENQFGPQSVLTFNNGSGKDTKFELRGFSQTLAGLSSDPDDTLSIIQNQEAGTNRNATLTINTANPTDHFVFTGLIRSQGSASGAGVDLVKTGPGTQEIRNISASAHNFGNATIDAGKLTFNISGTNNKLGANTNITVNDAGTLGLDGTWTMDRFVSGTGKVVKEGSGTVTLTGSFTQSGETTVNDGTLLVNGSISGNVVVDGAGAVLGGTGYIGPVSVRNGGTVNPGDVFGSMLNIGDLAMSTGTTLKLEINGRTFGLDYDQLNVTGSVSLADATLSLAGTFLTSLAEQNDPFFILLNDGTDAINGTFNGLPEGSHIASSSGQDFILTYKANADASSFTGGNDIALLAVPEPSAAMSLVGGLGVLLGMRRRRKG